MGLVLGFERRPQLLGHRPADTGVTAYFSAQCGDGVRSRFGLVIPALDGRCPNADPPVGIDGVLIGLSGQTCDRLSR